MISRRTKLPHKEGLKTTIQELKYCTISSRKTRMNPKEETRLSLLFAWSARWQKEVREDLVKTEETRW